MAENNGPENQADRTDVSKDAPLKKMYIACLLLGLGLVVYFYGITFDSWSETELVNYTPLWILPLVFGLYGLAAEWAISLVKRGKAQNLAAVARIVGRATTLVGLIPFIPFLFVKSMSSYRVAIAATIFWIGVYYFITQAIWHLL